MNGDPQRDDPQHHWEPRALLVAAECAWSPSTRADENAVTGIFQQPPLLQSLSLLRQCGSWQEATEGALPTSDMLNFSLWSPAAHILVPCRRKARSTPRPSQVCILRQDREKMTAEKKKEWERHPPTHTHTLWSLPQSFPPADN